MFLFRRDLVLRVNYSGFMVQSVWFMVEGFRVNGEGSRGAHREALEKG